MTNINTPTWEREDTSGDGIVRLSYKGKDRQASIIITNSEGERPGFEGLGPMPVAVLLDGETPEGLPEVENVTSRDVNNVLAQRGLPTCDLFGNAVQQVFRDGTESMDRQAA